MHYIRYNSYIDGPRTLTAHSLHTALGALGALGTLTAGIVDLDILTTVICTLIQREMLPFLFAVVAVYYSRLTFCSPDER